MIMKTIKYLLLFIITIGIFTAGSNLNNSSTSLNFVPVLEPKTAYSETFGEDANVYIYNDGEISNHYSIYGNAIQLDGVNLDYIQDLFPEQYDRFSSASWGFYNDYGDPFNQNVYLYLYFNTGDITVARSDAEWIMGFVNAFTVTDYIEDGVESYTGHTEIRYRGHASWPDLLDVYNASIPRDYGGLAETIDITNCNYFSFSISPSSSSVYRSFYCYWPGSQVEYLDGSFTFNFKDIIPVDKLQQLNGGYDSNIRFSLPNVTNLVVDPGYANINYNDYQSSWNLNHWYDISIALSSTEIDDFTVSFDHSFVPWDLMPRELAYVDVNPYGYARKEINIYHDNSDFINWTEHFPEIYLYSSTDYNLDRDDYAVDLSFKLRNLTGDNTETKSITFVNWIETNMPGGWVQTYSSNGSSSWWNGTEYIDAWNFYLHYNFTTMDETNLNLLWDSTWIYANSNMMQQTDLKTADSIRCYGTYTPSMGGYTYHHTTFNWNPLNRYETTLTKTFSHLDNPYHSISMLDLFGWSYFEKSADFYSSYLNFEVPISDHDSYTATAPTTYDDDYYYGFYTHTDQTIELRGYLESFSTTATVNDLAADFEYDFHPDTDDLVPPSGYVSTNNPYSVSYEQINFTATDDGNYGWWDEGYLDGSPHFPSSGILSVDYDLSYNALSGFNWEGSMTHYFDSEFGFTIDTSSMPDGWYTLQSVVIDNAGNQGYCWDNIEIDNFDDGTYVDPPSIELISHDLSENDKVMGDEILTFNITDDVGIFSSLITIDGTGWLLEDASNPDPDLYDFNWTTEIYDEGYHLVTVTSWDMEGHDTVEYYNFEVDNRPIGNPPEINIIDPSVPNQLIENWFTFRANITDDFKISSAQAQIDDRVPEDMIYNETLGLYEYNYDVSTLYNGTHTFNVIVYDFDENQHMVVESIEFFANTTNIEDLNDPPNYKNLIPGNFENASDIVTGTVEISVEVTDDLGIQAVQLTISEVTGLDPTDYPSYPGSVNEDDLSVVSGYPHSMTEGSVDGSWTTYTDSFDTTTTTDGLYLIEMLIGDVDPFSHTVTARFLMIIHNTMADPFAQIPGFIIEYFIGCIGISILVGYLTIKRKIKSK